MKYKNLILIGTSHIAKQSLNEVEEAIEKEKPSIIALELDKKRFYALTHNEERKLRLMDIKRIGIKGFLFNLFGAWAEEKLGKYVGMKPGAEMIKAIELARKNKIKIALIDQDIEITLKKISKSLTWKEKFNFLVDIFMGVFFKKRELKKYGLGEIDLTRVPSKRIIQNLVKHVKKRYPNLYKILIEERNKIMAANLRNLIERYPDGKIIAVIGAGHEEEIVELIKKVEGISYSFSINA
jgi:pheromone shutdown-related protein TraB